MKQVCIIIMQGVPGSGKSTKARLLSIERLAVILSTDDFHHREDGVYDFKRENARRFHNLNQDRCRHFLMRGVSVIIDNTNTDNRSASPYVRMAVALGIPVEFVRCIQEYKSIHDVPVDAMRIMRERMETLTVEAALAAQPY